MNNLQKFVEGLIDQIDEMLITPLENRFKSYDIKLKELFEHGVTHGKDGRDGVDGKDGKDGRDGVNGKDGLQGETGLLGDRGEKGEKGDNGNDGLNGKDGIDGKEGSVGEKGDSGPQGEQGVQGKNGKDGESGIQGEPGTAGKDGADGLAGKDGRDGVDGQNGKDGAIGVQGDRGLQGERGEKGMEGALGPIGPKGEDGKSITFADIESWLEAKFANWLLDFERRAIADAQKIIEKMPMPKDGKDGISVTDVKSVGDRTLVLSASDGRVVEIKFAFPLDRGVWREGRYDKGDGVSFGGSFWIAQNDTEARPGTDETWRLAVKKGRDGRSQR